VRLVVERMNLRTAFQPQRHREDSEGYTETAAHLPGGQPLRDERSYRQDSLRLRVFCGEGLRMNRAI
jgi:hypothetical protein